MPALMHIYNHSFQVVRSVANVLCRNVRTDVVRAHSEKETIDALRFVRWDLELNHIMRRLVINKHPRSPLLPLVSSTELIESISNSPFRTLRPLRARAQNPHKTERNHPCTCQFKSNISSFTLITVPLDSWPTYKADMSNRISRSCHILASSSSSDICTRKPQHTQEQCNNKTLK
jgi:hypothetical protein